MTRGSCSIFEYLQQAKSYANALVATGEPVSNTDITSDDLRGLGPEYDVLLVAIETYPTLLDLSAIHSWLLTFKAYHGSIMQPSPAASLATQTLHSMPTTRGVATLFTVNRTVKHWSADKESMEIDSSDDNNGNMTGLRKNDLTLWPVSANASGEGLPYAPINFPNLGDNWSWKAGKRIGVSGHFLDRYLYLPTRLQNKNKKRSFASKLSVEQYIRTTFPGADSDAFFASFSWRIAADNVPSAKGDKNEAYDSPVHSEEMAEYSALDSQSDTVRCKAGNKMCNSITAEAEDSTSALMLCDVCCSEPGFCRDCCCILCCKTVTSAYGSYSYIKCEAMVSEGYICGHVAHTNCALQAFMAGKVGGNIGLDAEYYCRRCDARTDLVLHVKRLLQVCESIDSRDEIEKILNVGLRILHGSQKATARRLLYRIESAMAKLKCGTCLEDIWKVEDNVLAFSSGKSMPEVTNHPHQRDFKTSSQQIMSTSSDHRFNSLKLDDEIDHVLQALKKSQESEYKIAKEKLCAQKNHLHNLYQQLNKERSELASRTSPDQDACLDVILNRMDQIKREVMKFNDMEEVAKGFGRTSKAMLKQHFGFGNDD